MANNKSIVYWEDIQKIAKKALDFIVFGLLIGIAGWFCYMIIYHEGADYGYQMGYESAQNSCQRAIDRTTIKLHLN